MEIPTDRNRMAIVGGAAVNEYGDGASWVRGPLLGKGSFGRVFKAALKKSRLKYSCYPPEMAVKSAEVSASSTLQKEREIMNNLEPSPYLIDCFGEETTIGDNGLMAYNLLLEYASGGTLADRIKNNKEGGLPELEVRAHTRSILRGLKSIHGAGYVHRDLKPDNILLVPNAAGSVTDFRAKIGDLGLAKRAKQPTTTANNYKKRKFMETCYWRGTPAYLSPEAVTDCVQEAPSDVWAVGCIVLEMLTGESAWEGAKEEILKSIGVKKELPRIIPNGLMISKEAEDFLKHCFVRNSKFRFTAEILLTQPFVEGLCDDDVEGSLDDECSLADESEEGSFCSWHEEDSGHMDDEITSPLQSRPPRLHPVGLSIPLGV